MTTNENPAPDAGDPLVGIPDGAGAAPRSPVMTAGSAAAALLPAEAGFTMGLCEKCHVPAPIWHWSPGECLCQTHLSDACAKAAMPWDLDEEDA